MYGLVDGVTWQERAGERWEFTLTGMFQFDVATAVREIGGGIHICAFVDVNKGTESGGGGMTLGMRGRARFSGGRRRKLWTDGASEGRAWPADGMNEGATGERRLGMAGELLAKRSDEGSKADTGPWQGAAGEGCLTEGRPVGEVAPTTKGGDRRVVEHGPLKRMDFDEGASTGVGSTGGSTGRGRFDSSPYFEIDGAVTGVAH